MINKTNKIKKVISGVLLFGLLSFGGFALATSPKDFNLTEGDLVRGENTLDIFIINEYGYKRLFLNPDIFNMYGHLGGWEDVKDIPVSTVDSFKTSNYYRLFGDTKVYKLEVTGDDTGVLHWVNVSQDEFLANVDENSIFTINQNELNWYTIGEDITSLDETPVIVANVKLASDNPESTTIPHDASNVEFLKVDVEGVNIEDVVIKHSGIGNKNELTNVYIYVDGERLTNDKSFDSDSKITFRNVNLSSPTTLSFRADLVDATASNEHSIELVSIGNTATGLPLSGNTMRIAGISVGTLTLENSGSLESVVIGQRNAQLAEFKLSAIDEGSDVKVKNIQLIQVGNADILNPTLIVDNETYDGTINSDDEIVFSNLDILIREGRSEKFEVYGDIDEDVRESETIELDIERVSDIFAVNTQLGFGVNIDTESFDSILLKVQESGELKTVKALRGDDVVAYWGEEDVNLGTFKFSTGEAEGFYIEELTFASQSVDSFLLDNVEELTVSYKDKNGNIETEDMDVDGDNKVVFEFSNRPYIPRDSSLELTVFATLLDEDDSERLIDKKIVLDSYIAKGASSDKEVEKDVGLESKVGLYTYAGYLTFESDTPNRDLDDNDEINVILTAHTNREIALSSKSFFNFDVRFIGDDDWAGMTWDARIDGEEAGGSDEELTKEETLVVKLTGEDTIIPLSNGEEIEIIITFGGDLDIFIDDNTMKVELKDNDEVYSWIDDYDGNEQLLVDNIEDLEVGLPLEFKYRND